MQVLRGLCPGPCESDHPRGDHHGPHRGERGGQDHHHQVHFEPDPPGQRNHHHPGEGQRGRRARRQAGGGRGAGRVLLPRLPASQGFEAHPGPRLSHLGRQPLCGLSEKIQAPGGEAHQGVLPGHEDEVISGRRPGPPAQAADPGRGHRRPGPGGAGRDSGRISELHLRRGPRHPHLQPHHQRPGEGGGLHHLHPRGEDRPVRGQGRHSGPLRPGGLLRRRPARHRPVRPAASAARSLRVRGPGDRPGGVP